MPEPRPEDLLESVEVETGSGSGPADASVVWMHGLGADGHDFESIVPHLGLPATLRVRFVFPHAPMIPVSLNMGMVMRAWYDLRGASLERIEHDEPGVRRSARQVEALLRREDARGVPASRTVLAGFSQGGAMALHVGLRHPEKLAGIVALSSFLVLADKLEAEASDANRATPVLVCHGTQDPMVPERMGSASAERLRRLGYDVAYHRFPMAHQVCLEEIALLGEWLTARLTPESSR
jgi:phospholipase/carboxylesterase